MTASFSRPRRPHDVPNGRLTAGADRRILTNLNGPRDAVLSTSIHDTATRTPVMKAKAAQIERISTLEAVDMI